MRWIGPEGDNKDFHRDSFCSFLVKNKKESAVIGISHWLRHYNLLFNRTADLAGVG